MPGDGIYHYMDSENQIGCHGVNAPQGQYMYSFWAEGANGERSQTTVRKCPCRGGVDRSVEPRSSAARPPMLG